MRRINDLLGVKFNKLTLIKEEPNERTISGQSKRRVRVVCDCGVEKIIGLQELIQGGTKSCGCVKKGLTVLKARKPVFGVGINDSEHSMSVDGVKLKSYTVWSDMMKRCYSKAYHAKYPTYNGCSVCSEWILYSNFKKWFDENYKEEYMQQWQLDKDIIVEGNKIYSPETCCFLPTEINSIIGSKRKYLKTNGVSFIAHKRLYHSRICKYGIKKHIGYYRDFESAKLAYNKEKKDHIINVAKVFFQRRQISEKVYNALVNRNN